MKMSTISEHAHKSVMPKDAHSDDYWLFGDEDPLLKTDEHSIGHGAESNKNKTTFPDEKAIEAHTQTEEPHHSHQPPDISQPDPQKPINEPSHHSDKPVVLPDVGRPGYWLFGDHATFVATAKDTNNQFSLFDFTTIPQGGPLVHTHYLEGEFAYILEGEVSYQIHDETFTATPGSFIYEPLGHPHAFANLGTETARHLVFSFPSGLENLFAESGIPGSRFSPPTPPPPSSDFVDNNVKLLNKYGIEAQNSIIFAPLDYNSTKSGTPEVTLFRPGEAKGAVGVTLAVDDNAGNNIASIPVNFADGERFKTIPIDRELLNTTDTTLNLALKNPTRGATLGMLQDKAKIAIADDDTYTITNGNTPDSLPKLLPDSDRPSYWLGGDKYNVVATGDDTEGNLSLFEVVVPPQEDDYLLYNPTDVGYFVLDGNVTFQRGEESFTAAPDTFVLLPEGDPYAITNLGSTDAKTLAFSTSSDLENFISYFGKPEDPFSPPCNCMPHHSHTEMC
jgi:quercetin dioxygenase-like cupin family protein